MVERAAAVLPEADDRRDLCERVEAVGRILASQRA
jgi:hypothetical protein